MTHFVVQLTSGGDKGTPRRYHLYDDQGDLLATAQREAAGPDDLPQRVRFTQADGQVAATLDLPRSRLSREEKEDAQHIDYVLVVDHAVYAIIHEYQAPAVKGEAKSLYYTLEVEGRYWLALQERADAAFNIYDEAPSILAPYEVVSALDLPEPVGKARRVETEEGENTAVEYQIDLAPDQMQHTGLVALALVFLINRAG